MQEGSRALGFARYSPPSSLAGSAHGLALAADAHVKIADFTFDPPTLTVKAGTTVTWINADDIPHLVSEKDGKFRSAALDTNDKFSQTLGCRHGRVFLCHPSAHDGKDRRHPLNAVTLAEESFNRLKCGRHQ